MLHEFLREIRVTVGAENLADFVVFDVWIDVRSGKVTLAVFDGDVQPIIGAAMIDFVAAQEAVDAEFVAALLAKAVEFLLVGGATVGVGVSAEPRNNVFLSVGISEHGHPSFFGVLRELDLKSGAIAGSMIVDLCSFLKNRKSLQSRIEVDDELSAGDTHAMCAVNDQPKFVVHNLFARLFANEEINGFDLPGFFLLFRHFQIPPSSENLACTKNFSNLSMKKLLRCRVGITQYDYSTKRQ